MNDHIPSSMIHVDLLGFSCDFKVYVLPVVVRLDDPVRHADETSSIDVTEVNATESTC